MVKKAAKKAMAVPEKAIKARTEKAAAAPENSLKAMRVTTYQPRHSPTQPNWFTMKECVKKLLCEQHPVLPGLKEKWTPHVLTDLVFDFLRHRKLILQTHFAVRARIPRRPLRSE